MIRVLVSPISCPLSPTKPSACILPCPPYLLPPSPRTLILNSLFLPLPTLFHGVLLSSRLLTSAFLGEGARTLPHLRTTSPNFFRTASHTRDASLRLSDGKGPSSEHLSVVKLPVLRVPKGRSHELSCCALHAEGQEVKKEESIAFDNGRKRRGLKG